MEDTSIPIYYKRKVYLEVLENLKPLVCDSFLQHGDLKEKSYRNNYLIKTVPIN